MSHAPESSRCICAILPDRFHAPNTRWYSPPFLPTLYTLKLTKSVVESLPLTTSGQTFYRDSELKGFGLRVGNSLKVYIVESKLNGKTVRATIGRHGVFTSEQTRNEARQKLGMIAKGINPLDDAKTKRAQVTQTNCRREL